MTDKPKRRWYQYSLRTLFTVMTLFAIACSWYAYEMGEEARRQTLRVVVSKSGGCYTYSYDPNPDDYGHLRPAFTVITLFTIACSWYAYEMDKAAKRRTSIAELENLGGKVYYYDTNDPDTYGQPPGRFALLRKRNGDKHLGYAAYVDLDSTQVTDAELTCLQDLKMLQKLDLTRTQITDAGLIHLKGLKRLQELNIKDTPITTEGVKNLQEALPNCKITR